MLESIIQLDKDVLIFLNNLGNETWDPVWLFITKQFNWVPFFAVILFFMVKHFGWKKAGFILLAIAVLITFSDQFTNLIKNTTQRLRPCNDPTIKDMLRIVKPTGGYSFMSGHATTSTFFSVFAILLLRKKMKQYAFFILLFPILFSYSRLYLGVHFPIDILVGITIGFTFGNLYFLLFKKVYQKVFKEKIEEA